MEDIQVSPRQTDLVKHLITILILSVDDRRKKLDKAFSKGDYQIYNVLDMYIEYVSHAVNSSGGYINVRYNSKSKKIYVDLRTGSFSIGSNLCVLHTNKHSDSEAVKKIVGYIRLHGIGHKSIRLGNRANEMLADQLSVAFQTYRDELRI